MENNSLFRQLSNAAVIISQNRPLLTLYVVDMLLTAVVSSFVTYLFLK